MLAALLTYNRRTDAGQWPPGPRAVISRQTHKLKTSGSGRFLPITPSLITKYLQRFGPLAFSDFSAFLARFLSPASPMHQYSPVFARKHQNQTVGAPSKLGASRWL